MGRGRRRRKDLEDAARCYTPFRECLRSDRLERRVERLDVTDQHDRLESI